MGYKVDTTRVFRPGSVNSLLPTPYSLRYNNKAKPKTTEKFLNSIIQNLF
ncbi:MULTISPECIES: hypothetical protein [unclassified Moorena]|nr:MULTISPECIES: hypothetical protein [unclassified Moorena]NEO09658.1 hypothetical protein [Moorena sp. SIO3I8]NEO19259.1 hypothetical protein [Moorena sp. SIO4A5]NEP20879.1 hypothetical protein [Moorena sp. SIO3I6]NEQ56963.1 hypothetical protein [Moorena sp. SIO4A1]